MTPSMPTQTHSHQPRSNAAAARRCTGASVHKLHGAAEFGRTRGPAGAASEALKATPNELAGALLLDVRPRDVFQRSASLIAQALWRDPAEVSCWAGELGAGRDGIVCCDNGHDVSRATAIRLRAADRRGFVFWHGPH